MKHLILFDVDGTLAPSTHQLQDHIKQALQEIMDKNGDTYDFGIVGGSSAERIKWQLSAGSDDNNDQFLAQFKWLFSENGLVAHKNEVKIHHQSLREAVPERALQKVLDWSLKYIANLTGLPHKRGKFIDFRSGLIYITPCGSNVTQEERETFARYDESHKIRETMIHAMHEELGEELQFDFQLGGQIGLGAHPKGWDKTYCLQHLKSDDGSYMYDKIYFIGDRCNPWGNDFPLFSHPDTIGYATKNPEHTLEILAEIL